MVRPHRLSPGPYSGQAAAPGLLALAVLVIVPAALRAAEPPSFARQVAPLLQARCLRCHAGNHPKGDLDLTTARGIQEGGASGPVVRPGKAADSLLFTHVRDRKMPPKQPLAAAEVELLRRWIDAGARWEGPSLAVAAPKTGRAGKDWWSLQPVRRSALPTTAGRAWNRNPIDAFVLARLEAKGLGPAPAADRRTWLRRVTVDLTGLLPTPNEIEAFLADQSPDAYEKVADRLLASPHYGERWGRHWLDVVRFAESHGYEMNTLRPNAWPYRDYVIRAFNRDTPFARFVREQLAGDAEADGDVLTRAATGFLVGGPHDMVGNATKEGQLQQRMDDLYDMVSTTGSAFLSLTLNCARCHDHKFDPITQKDYYSVQAVFAGVQHADRLLPPVVSATGRRAAADLRAALARLEARIDEQEPPARPSPGPARRRPVHPRRNVERFPAIEARFVRFTVSATSDGTEPCLDELEIYSAGPTPRNLALASAGARASASSVYPNNPLHRVEHLNDGRHGNGRSWISNERGRGWALIALPHRVRINRVVWGRDREEKYADRLATDYRVEISADGKSWTTVAGSWDRLPYRPQARGANVADSDPLRSLLAERARLAGRLAELEKPRPIYAGTFAAPPATHLLKRGDPLQPQEVVGPGAVQSLGVPFELKPNASDRERRLALARWIADPRNPLPARVMVNRLWHYHFGQGLVRTPSDFGFNGDRPSHPELLDWLADEFRVNGGRLKPLHRLVVLSATYRQSSRINPAARAVDADGRLWWRYPPRRLEAEALRDAVLQVSGRLNRRMGGPGYHLWEYSGYVIVFKPKARLGPDEFRRMVYQFKPRTQQDETFGVFDCPDATLTMPRRNVSTTALQALNLLNGAFIQQQSESFAGRLRQEAGGDLARQVRRAFLLAFGRAPNRVEEKAAVDLVRTHGLAMLCRALFNANEFVYVN